MKLVPTCSTSLFCTQQTSLLMIFTLTCKYEWEYFKPNVHLRIAHTFHWYQKADSSVEPRFTNAPVHEQFGSRTNFPSKKVSDDERCLGIRTRNLATAVGDKLRVSARECQLRVTFGSVHIPAWIRRSFSWISLCVVFF
jgi:hypothetical protein